MTVRSYFRHKTSNRSWLAACSLIQMRKTSLVVRSCSYCIKGKENRCVHSIAACLSIHNILLYLKYKCILFWKISVFRLTSIKSALESPSRTSHLRIEDFPYLQEVSTQYSSRQPIVIWPTTYDVFSDIGCRSSQVKWFSALESSPKRAVVVM